MNPFIPDDYEQPKSDSDYLRLEDGENKIRILSSPIYGWEGWVTEGETRKPIRVPYDKKAECKSQDKIKHFWALGVYNYKAKAVQIWSFTQATIIEALTGLAKNADWGDPREYDIVITRSGKEMNTSYQVLPTPKSLLAPEIALKEKEKPYVLERLFEGEDPFEVDAHPSQGQNPPAPAPEAAPPPNEEPITTTADGDKPPF